MVRGMRYGDKNYLWINDLRSVMVMHPIKPEMKEGKDLSGYVDPKGTRIFEEFAKMAREKGSGTLYYWWPKPGQVQPVKKVSYVREFQPSGRVIGTGTYIDDVNAAWWTSALQSGGIALCLSGRPAGVVGDDLTVDGAAAGSSGGADPGRGPGGRRPDTAD